MMVVAKAELAQSYMHQALMILRCSFSPLSRAAIMIPFPKVMRNGALLCVVDEALRLPWRSGRHAGHSGCSPNHYQPPFPPSGAAYGRPCSTTCPLHPRAVHCRLSR